MATIKRLVTKGELISYNGDPDDRRKIQRALYVTPDFASWVEDFLDFEPRDQHIELEPSEQVFQIFNEFVYGDHMGRDEMRKLDPLGNHVWELKPKDVRVFGYFYQKDVFIAICGEMRKKLKPYRMYKPFINQVINFRDNLGIDDPSYIKGDWYEVISV